MTHWEYLIEPILSSMMVIKNTLCLSSSLQVNRKVPSYTMKVMVDYSDKRHSEFSDEDMTC